MKLGLQPPPAHITFLELLPGGVEPLLGALPQNLPVTNEASFKPKSWTVTQVDEDCKTHPRGWDDHILFSDQEKD